MEVNRITGGSSEFIALIRSLQGRVSSLETRGTGSIFISDQIVTQDPNTGVETIFGALPDGRFGLQEWVNDTEPPAQPSQPLVAGDRAIYEITWDGLDIFGAPQPPDYDRTVVQMSSSLSSGIWVEVGYFAAAGRVVVANQEYGQEKHFRLVSYDKNNNPSNPSLTTSAVLVSFMDSPAMTEYILDVETAVSDANTAASNAQTAAGNAQTAASNAETAASTASTTAANAEKIAQDAVKNSPNLVQNGSFENDFVGWTKEANGGTIATTGAYDGTKSWTVGTTGGGILQAAIPVKAGQIFEMSAYYKTLAGYSGSGGIRIQTSTDGTAFANTVSNTLTANVNWTLTTIEYTIPAGVTHIRPRIAFASGAAMTVWIDKVALTDVTTIRALQKAASDATAAASAATTKANDAATAASNAATVAADAATAAGNAQTAANNKNTVWNQPTKPAGTAHRVGDIWFDTDNENLIHTWNGTDFVSRQDGAINRAFTDIGTAQTAANNAASAASSATSVANEALGTANTANSTANTAAGNASTALSNANSAVTAANGKNKITTSTSVAPTDYVGAVGDEWRQRNTVTPFEIIKVTSWDGSAWVNQTLGNAVIENLNASKLNAGTISADRIGANTLTAEKLLVGSVANLVPDPIFSTTTVWTANRQATGGMDGGGSLLIPTGTTLRGFYFGDTTTTVNHRIPVVAGGRYRVAVFVQTSTAAAINTISLYGKVWKSTATTTTTATIPGVVRNTVTTPAGTGWTRITGVFEIPAGYDRLTLGFYAEAGYTGTARFSNPMVQQAATGELIVDGAITTLKMAADSITAESGIIASLDASKITVGELEGTRVKAGTVTADKLVVGQGDNLIAEPRFMQNSALTNARIAASTAGAVWSTPDYIGWNKTSAATGVHNLKLGGLVSNVNQPVIVAIPGRQYIVNWKVYADNAGTSTRAIVKWLSRTNVASTSTGTAIPLKSTGLSTYSTEFTAPADAAFLTVEVEFTSHPGGGWIDFYQPSIELMTDGTVITKDAILTRHIKAGEITGGVLDMVYIKGQVITSTMFQGQTFSGGQFQQATFETSPLAATGVKMSPTLGFVGYNASQQPVFQVDPSGNATFTGTVNITGGSVPESVIPGLTATLDDHEAAATKVWNWSDPVDRTLINGGHIATNSITANQIALGSGQNFITGGDGGDRRGWDNFEYGALNAGWPAGTQSIYILRNNKLAYSPSFNVSGLNKYSFSYSFSSEGPTIYHETAIVFYDINSAFISMVKLGRKSSSTPWGLGNGTITNQSAPSGAVYAKVYVEHNWQTGDALGTTQFAMFKMTTGAQTMLTASGLSSYNNGMQTLRLNGEDNLVIGEFITGRPGIEPYIKMKSTSTIGAIDFFGVPGGVANHGALWYNQGDLEDGNWGKMSLYAIDDARSQSNVYYASGLEYYGSGRAKYFGTLDKGSQTFKTGTHVWASPGLGRAGDTEINNYVLSTVTFAVPYRSGLVPKIFITFKTSNNNEMVCSVQSVSNTGFTVWIVNLTPTRRTNAMEMHWMAVLGP